MMTMSLPIPSKKQKISFYYVPYDIKKDYINKSGELMLRATDSFQEFRSKFQKVYKRDAANFTITRVVDNTFKNYYN